MNSCRSAYVEIYKIRYSRSKNEISLIPSRFWLFIRKEIFVGKNHLPISNVRSNVTRNIRKDFDCSFMSN